MASNFSLFLGLLAVVVLITSEVAANDLTKISSSSSDQTKDTKTEAKLDDSKSLRKLGGGYPGGTGDYSGGGYNGGGYSGGNYPGGGYHGGGYSGGNYPGGGYHGGGYSGGNYPGGGGCYNGCCLNMLGWCMKCCNYATSKASEKQVEINGHN